MSLHSYIATVAPAQNLLVTLSVAEAAFQGCLLLVGTSPVCVPGGREDRSSWCLVCVSLSCWVEDQDVQGSSVDTAVPLVGPAWLLLLEMWTSGALKLLL